ncbi:MAG: peptidylprolyl isomerase [Thiotrichales bacterium]
MNYAIPASALAALLAFTLSGCDQASSPAAVESERNASAEVGGDVIATVNSRPITLQAFSEFLNAKTLAGTPESTDPSLVLNEMINRELVKQDALAKGIAERAEFKSDLEKRRDELLVSAMIGEQRKSIDFSDAVLKQEYDNQIKELDLKEYKARHILVDEEDAAKAIIADLKAGKSFEALAKDQSKDPSAAEGGDLGWFPLSAVVPEFGEATQGLEKGKFTETPVRSQFGWHIIQLDDVKVGDPPKFDEVKDQLEMVVTNKAMQGYIGALRQAAKIDVIEAKADAAAPSDAAPEPAGKPDASTEK